MTRKSSTRPRGRAGYSMKKHGQSSRQGLSGDFVIRKGAADVWRPSWNGTVTTFRPYPALTPEADHSQGAVWDPYRFTTEYNDFGDWMRMYPAVRNWGSSGVTFLLYDPTDEQMALNPETHPVWVFYRAIEQIVSANQDRAGWYSLLKGGNNRGAELSKPSELYLMQGALFMHKNKPFNPPRGSAEEDNPVVMQLGPSAGEGLCTELDERIQDFRGDADDWNSMYKAGDPVSLQHGSFINFCQKGYRDQGAGQNQSGFGGSRSTGGGGGEQKVYGYDCWLTPDYNGMQADFSAFEQAIVNKVKPWQDIIQILPYEEQAHLVCGVFPPDAVAYAFRDHDEWLTDSVKQAAAGGQVQGHTVDDEAQPATQTAEPQNGGQQMMFGGTRVDAAPAESTLAGGDEDQGMPDGEIPETPPVAEAAAPAATSRGRRTPPPTTAATKASTEEPAAATAVADEPAAGKAATALTRARRHGGGKKS